MLKQKNAVAEFYVLPCEEGNSKWPPKYNKNINLRVGTQSDTELFQLM